MTSELECNRLDQRRRAVMSAAHSLFIEQGFERTTLSDIVERAGGSLSTVYKLFGNKEGLLDAVVFERAASGENLIQEIAKKGEGPVPALRNIAKQLHARFLAPEDVALVRIVIAHSIADTKFARRFFETTASRTRQALEDLFAKWQMAGISMNGTADMLAEVFLGLIINDFQNDAISHGVLKQPSAEKLAARTDFFLKGAGLIG